MIARACRQIFHHQGWTVRGEEIAEHRRCVVVGVPHTSNWDFVYMIATFDMLGLPLKFTIKREWMRFPLNLVIGSVGGLSIDRRPRRDTGERPSMVDEMVRLFDDYPDELALVITPEGTRRAATRWKSGFYHVARGAGVPILLGYADYAKKEAGVGKVIEPSGDFDADMREIMEFYRPVTPKHPERFALDERFVD